MLRSMFILGLVTGGVVLAGCGRGAKTPSEGRPVRPDNKAGIKVEVSVEPGTVVRSNGGRAIIRVMVTNLSDKPKTLEFSQSTQYSVYAIDSGGREYRLGPVSEPLLSTMTLDARETKFFEMAWDGHVRTGGDVAYLPPGKYEIEARIKNAFSNTEFVWLRE